uniref:CCHC-type domain-containing protein n=1 Tax=Oryzias latipes TaxID=8090 RepID=A0A3B3HH37_ORYLA
MIKSFLSTFWCPALVSTSPVLTLRSGQTMDAVGADSSRADSGNQEQLIRHLAEQLEFLRRGMMEMADHQERQMTGLCNRLDLLATQVQQSSPPIPSSAVPVAPIQTPPAPAVQLARPERFSGDSGDCRAFITQCELYFELNAAAFPTERSKVAFIISHLTDRAGAWATAEWQRGAATCASLPAFLEAFSQVFQHTKPGTEAARALMRLGQGTRRVADYAIEFRTLGTESDWNPAALTNAFLEGLSEEMKDQLAPLEIPSSLEPLIALAIRIDNRLQDRRQGRRTEVPRSGGRAEDSSSYSSHARSVTSTNPPDEPMLLGRGRLSPAERKRLLTAGECLYCGQRGHICRDCPNASARH